MYQRVGALLGALPRWSLAFVNLRLLYNNGESAQLGTARRRNGLRGPPKTEPGPPPLIKYKTGHPSFAALGGGTRKFGMPDYNTPLSTNFRAYLPDVF